MDKNLLCRLNSLLDQLKQGKDILTQNLDSENEEWQQELVKILPSKNEAKKILDRLTEDYQKDMIRRVDRRQKMRLRKRRQLKSAHEENELTVRRISEKHREIDDILAAEIKEKEKKKQDTELQNEIDNTLSEVRRKKKEMTQQQKLYRALRRLRLIRQNEGRITVTPEDHDKFERGMKEVEEFVRQRSLMYREEEKTMQVMLEGERDEMRAQEDERTLKKKAKAEAARLKTKTEILFGEAIMEEATNDQSFIAKFYNQANENLQPFIDIRKQWDAYIVTEGSEGSTIPINWVSPVAPSSEMWANTLKE